MFKILEHPTPIPSPVALVFSYGALDFNFTCAPDRVAIERSPAKADMFRLFSAWMTPENLKTLCSEQSSANIPGVQDSKDHLVSASGTSHTIGPASPARADYTSLDLSLIDLPSPSSETSKIGAVFAVRSHGHLPSLPSSLSSTAASPTHVLPHLTPLPTTTADTPRSPGSDSRPARLPSSSPPPLPTPPRPTQKRRKSRTSIPPPTTRTTTRSRSRTSRFARGSGRQARGWRASRMPTRRRRKRSRCSI